MSIWFNKELSIEKFSKVGQKTMGDFLGIEWVEIGDDFIKARMPVDERTKQPYGLLHGGALPLHLGKSTHVWDIKIYNEEEKMVCVSRLTVAIIQKRDFSKTRSL